MRERAVCQHHALLDHVIDRLPITPSGRRSSCWPSCRPRWRGWPTRRPARSAVVWPEHRVQIVEHHARFDPRPSLVRIDLDDAVRVLRRVEHQAGADRLAGLRRAAAARRDRHAVFRGNRDGADHGSVRLSESRRRAAGSGKRWRRMSKARAKWRRSEPRRRLPLRARAAGARSCVIDFCRGPRSATRPRRDRRAARRSGRRDSPTDRSAEG